MVLRLLIHVVFYLPRQITLADPISAGLICNPRAWDYIKCILDVSLLLTRTKRCNARVYTIVLKDGTTLYGDRRGNLIGRERDVMFSCLRKRLGGE